MDAPDPATRPVTCTAVSQAPACAGPCHAASMALATQRLPQQARRQGLAWLAAQLAGGMGLGFGLPGGTQAARTGADTKADDLSLRPWPARQPTPPLVLPAMGGQPWSLADQKGKPVLLNFWASWCGPCRAEMPSLDLLAARHAAQGLQVLAVNFRETDATVAAFIESAALGLTVLRDRDGNAARAFGVRTFPSTVAINRRGRVVSTVIGEVDWGSAAARRWVAAVL